MLSFPMASSLLICHSENVDLLQVRQYLFMTASTSKARVQHTLEGPAYSKRKKQLIRSDTKMGLNICPQTIPHSA